MLISTNRIHQGLDGHHVVDHIFDVFYFMDSCQRAKNLSDG